VCTLTTRQGAHDNALAWAFVGYFMVREKQDAILGRLAFVLEGAGHVRQQPGARVLFHIEGLNCFDILTLRRAYQ